MFDKRRSRERIQWADLDRHRQTFSVTGRGEGLRTVYFGAGFSRPPTFDFSSVITAPERNVVPHVVVQPRGSLDNDVDRNNLGNDSQSAWNGYIADPSFEVQSQFSNPEFSAQPVRARTIPNVDDVRKLIRANRAGPWLRGETEFSRMPVAQHWWDNSSHNDNLWESNIGWRQPSYWWNLQGPHFWLQTGEERNVWTTTKAQSHDLGIGEAGKYSATATIGPSGYTNWLIPIGDEWFYMLPDDGYEYISGDDWYDITDAIYSEHMFYSVREWPGFKWRWGPFQQEEGVPSSPPPHVGGFEGFAYVKSASGCTLETQAVFHHWEGDAADDGLNEVVFTDDKVVGFTGHNDETTALYRMIATVEDSSSVTGGDWKRVDIELPYEGERPLLDTVDGDGTEWTEFLENENYPWFKKTNSGGYAWPFWRLKFRVKGTPGEVVYLDNVYLYKQLRNAQAPHITVGVAEWIRDEAGVYVGAHLWFKMGQP